jgi:hypothetical protein
MTLDTERIMAIALELAGLSDIPEDSGIWNPGKNIKKVLFGIDVGSAELDIAKRMGFDLAIAHHPPEATLNANRVYLGHVDQMIAEGVSRKVAEQAVAEEIEGMQLRAHARNYDHTVSVAKLIGIPFMNIHRPLDEIGRMRFINKVSSAQKKNSKLTLGEMLDVFDEFGEVKKSGQRPFIAPNEPDTLAGRVVVSHGVLDIPNYAVLAAYFAEGVNTIVTLRVSQGDLSRLRRERPGALFVTGHNAGDSVGINPFLAALEAEGIEVTRFSGVIPA